MDNIFIMGTMVIPQFEDVIKELVLPEWLNGKEVSQAFLQKERVNMNHLMETCRCFQSLYAVICSARLNLSCACRKDYPELLDSNNPQLSYVWMRSQFVNNAILWYNAAFDLTLQPLWIYYKVYTKTYPNLRLTTESLDKILVSCRFDKLKKNGISEIGNDLISQLDVLNSSIQNNIRLWANTLKHRKKIEYIELSYNYHPFVVGDTFTIGKDKNGRKTIMIHDGEYNSSKTVKYVDMNEVVYALINFHKELIPITKDIEDQINL